MNILSRHQIEKILESGKDKYLLEHHIEKNGITYLVEKESHNVVGRVRKAVLNGFDTKIYGTPKRYYEFV